MSGEKKQFDVNQEIQKIVGNGCTLEEIIEYRKKQETALKANSIPGYTEKEQAIHEKLKKAMVVNKADHIKEQLPAVEKEKTEYMKRLRDIAVKTASANAKKKERNQIAAERKAAREELKRIREERIKNGQNKPGMNADTFVEDISTAKKWNGLTRLVNYFSLGSRDLRRNPSEKYPEDALAISHINREKKMELNGALFNPQHPNGKYAIVFSGSGGPGAEYINSIKDGYLENGITVIQLDYRGFGKSRSITSEGKPAKTYPSEHTLYEDGMEMYRFVKDKLKVDPKNIILHGYSLGGAVASKVALEATKELQIEHMNNPQKPLQSLGGIVMHSPMKSLEYASGTMTHMGFIGSISKAVAGGYDTEKHLVELSSIDKEIPVHMIGGNKDKKHKDFDWLSPQATGIDKTIEKNFINTSSYIGQGNHEGKESFVEDGETYVRPLPNVVAEDRGLVELINGVRKNRSMELGNVAENQPGQAIL